MTVSAATLTQVTRTDWQQRAAALQLRARAFVDGRYVDALSGQTPFGGFERSGVGRDRSLHAIDKYAASKTAWFTC